MLNINILMNRKKDIEFIISGISTIGISNKTISQLCHKQYKIHHRKIIKTAVFRKHCVIFSVK